MHKTITATKPEAYVAGLSLSKAMKRRTKPELVLCHECKRLHLLVRCDCKGAKALQAEASRAAPVDPVLVELIDEYTLHDESVATIIAEPDDTATFAPVAYHACQVCLGDGEIPAEGGKGWKPCPHPGCRRMNVVRADVVEGGADV